MIGPPDDPANALPEASAERGRGGGEQEGGAVPPHPEGAGRGEGDQRAPAEAAARAAPADKVRAHTFDTSHASIWVDVQLFCDESRHSLSQLLYCCGTKANTPSFCHCPSNRRKETLTIRQTLDNLRLDLSVDDEDEDKDKAENQQETSVTNV